MCQDDKSSEISSFNDSCFQDNSYVSIMMCTLKFMLTLMKIINFII